MGHGATGPDSVRFVSLARWLGDATPDPTVRVERTRQAGPRGLTEEIVVSSTATEPVHTTVTVDLACDLAPIEQVKIGRAVAPLATEAGEPGRVRWAADGSPSP
ncbi:glycogen debranching N-terminal domain-containing protein [Micromonospora sp. BRA006-A]|nr:glycogen debranching N-terminal domain-containing protein [Micromonospora sp. BRA006-A]